MTRKTVIVANWKMNKTEKEALLFMDEFAPLLKKGQEAYIAAPFTSLPALVSHETSASIFIGAQNMSQHKNGAFTGEVSIKMLRSLGVQFVILGHSERRHIFGETDEMLKAKVDLAVDEDIPFIFCIGETLEQRESGQMEQVLRRQISSALKGKSGADLKKIILAYEPVWAIGTGKAATPQMADEAHNYCRTILSEIVSKNFAESITILYGGSVKPENSKELLGQSHIDGFLVGGASLDPQSFAKLTNL
ncbi:MAG: triose-phosphate isomerase [Rhabdochlamydiaceae bacterium]|nr:triose-phosphate isomerase [Candidatus Amphrikana amoebophyrae]